MAEDKKNKQHHDTDDLEAAFNWVKSEPADEGEGGNQAVIAADDSGVYKKSEGVSPFSEEATRLLLSMNRRMSASVDLDELLVSVLDDVIRFTRAERGVIFLYEGFEELLETTPRDQAREPLLSIKVARDRHQQTLPTAGMKVSHSVVQEVAQNGNAVCLFDAPNQDEYAFRNSIVSLQLTTIMAAPLKAIQRLRRLHESSEDVDSSDMRYDEDEDSQVIGVLYVDSTSHTVFSDPALLEVFESIANQAALAIENTWMNQRLHSSLQSTSQMNKRLTALQEVSNAISSNLILDDLLELIVDKCIQLGSAQRGCLVLANPETKAPEFRTARTAKGDNIDPSTLKVSKSTLHRSLKFGEVVVINDLEQERIGVGNNRNSIFDLQLKAVVCVPLIVPSFASTAMDIRLDQDFTEGPASERRENRIIGCIYVDSNVLVHQFSDDDVETLQAFAQQAAISIQNATLYQSAEEQLFETVSALAATIDAKDPYTHGHSYRVAKFSVAIAEELDFPPLALKRLYLAGLLHDIGKVGVPDAVLGKPGGLTDEEFGQMKMHPVYGSNILSKVQQMQDLLGAMEHHEKVDGSGYPHRLTGEQISLIGRVISVADAFDAMTSDRVYRKGLPIEFALEELEQKSGTQFDEECVRAFLRAYRRNKITPIVNYVPESPLAHE